MGEAQRKQRDGFPKQLIEQWEAEDCVNFAVALARVTGWLIHVDWWDNGATNRREDSSSEGLIPLRVYVADNHDQIFDVRGIKHFTDFVQKTVSRRVRQLGYESGGLLTRYYSEAKLQSLPLRFKPEEQKIEQAMGYICTHPQLFNSIPVRSEPRLPAHDAARYTFGNCSAFAEAMAEKKGLKATALCAVRFAPLYANTHRSDDGYVHSLVLHADGTAEDSWGRASLEQIASRFGLLEYRIDADEHKNVVANILKNTPGLFHEEKARAATLIDRHLFRAIDSAEQLN